MSGSDGVDWDNSASRFPGSRSAAPGSAFPHYFAIRNPSKMWTGLTSNISPRRNTIATQETISAWFWMINSWLITGGFLLVFFRIPMSTRFGPKLFSPLLPSQMRSAFYKILSLAFGVKTLKAPSCFSL